VFTPTATGTATITATSTEDTTKSGNASVTVTPPPATTSVSVSCSPATVVEGQTSQCTATVQGTGSYSSGVSWTATGGTITSAGVFTPTATGTATITATSTEDTTKSGNASVTVTPPPAIRSVSASCSPTTVVEGQTSTCMATVQGTGSFDPTVTWAATFGTIASNANDAATYTAPSSTTGTSTVTATSSVDTTKSGTTTLSVVIPPPSSAFQVVGPLGGYFTALAADPTSPGTVYASTFGFGEPGQFLQSTDNAKTWQDMGQSLASITASGVDSIAVSPLSGAVYVGGIGPILTSRNRGTTWSQIPLPTEANSVVQLSVDPLSDDNLYGIFNGEAGTIGLYGSNDAGGNWSQLSTSCSRYFVVDPKTEGTLYCTGGSEFFVSNDGGITWTNTSQIAGMSLDTFAVVPSNPKQIYLITNSPGINNGFLYSSTDGGGSWTWVRAAGDAASILVDATNPLELYASTFTGFEVSEDGGTTWTTSATAPGSIGLLVQIPGSPSTLLGESDGNLVSSQNTFTTWSEADTGISDHWGYQVAVDPEISTTIYLAATNDGGIYKSANSGTTWGQTYADNCNAISVDPLNSKHLLAGCLTSKSVVSNDGGATWQSVPLNFVGSEVFAVTLIVFDPNSPGTIYLGIVAQSGPSVAKSSDGGASWSLIDNGLPTASSASNNVGDVYSFAISPTNSNLLLVCIAGATGGIYKSTDAGATWTLQAPVAAYSLAFDPNHPGNVYAAADYIYKSTDSGDSWSTVAFPSTGFAGLSAPVQLIVDPKSADMLFMVPSAGPIGWSPDGGNTWFPLSNGLTSDIGLGGSFGFLSAISATDPEILYIPSLNRSLISLVLQH